MNFEFLAVLQYVVAAVASLSLITGLIDFVRREKILSRLKAYKSVATSVGVDLLVVAAGVFVHLIETSFISSLNAGKGILTLSTVFEVIVFGLIAAYVAVDVSTIVRGKEQASKDEQR